MLNISQIVIINLLGETVTMWLLEKDGKRASNKELQAFLEEHGNELNPVLYTELSGEELERKVNDAWKDGVNYLNGQKVSGASGGVLRGSAYLASIKDTMDDTGLTNMAMSFGFGVAAAKNKPISIKKTIGRSYTGKRNRENDFKNGKGVSTLEKHTLKHQYDSADEYLADARQFLEKKPTLRTETFVSKEGTYFRYDAKTNEFRIINEYGSISTYFKPNAGLKYWEKQIDLYYQK